jgi:Zn-dependent peptidase ImmA (M78 family)/DNA-binding XRE family transcriptional regulator
MGSDAIAANLRRLRKAQGLTQAQLADAAGLSRVGYRNIETGRSLPRVDTLQAVAAALRAPLQDLVTPVAQLRHVRFRSLRRLNTRDQILAEVSRWLSDFNDLETLLGDRPDYRLHGFVVPKVRPTASRAREAASEVRKLLRLHNDEPIRDICGLLESNGIKVYSIRLASNEFFGLSVGPTDGGPAIVVNIWERISVERWIFSAAHELGHLVLHQKDYDVVKLQEEKSQEQEANVFAAHFLMPEDVFRREWAGTAGMPLVDRVLKVKRIFRVSYKTILYRLSETAGEGVNVWQLFQKEFKRLHERTLLKEEEPAALAADAYRASFPESSRAGEPDDLSPHDFREDRLSLLVRKGVQQGAISLSRGAEVLRKPLKEMRALANTWVGNL